jgi:hypothetical protein
MGTFKNSVPEIRQGNETIKDINLHNTVKDKVPTFYDSEVEYVLHGNPSQKINNIMTKGELLSKACCSSSHPLFWHKFFWFSKRNSLKRFNCTK